VSKYFEEIPQFESMAYNTMHYANYRRTAFKLLDDGSISDEDDLLSIAELDAQIKAYYFSGQLIHHKEAIAKSATFTKMFEKYPFEMRKLQNAIDIFGQKDHQKIKVDI
jgi:flagellar biosynthesis regulator FlbT